MDLITAITLAVSAFCGFLASLIGGFDTLISTLLLFITLDLILGVLLSVTIHSSKKTESGRFSSNVFYWGITCKFLEFFVIIVAFWTDTCIATYIYPDYSINFIRNTACLFYIFNEGSSILEHLAIAGVPLPGIVSSGLDILKEQDNRKI